MSLPMASRQVVSVLMPCLNPGPYLNEAIASCLVQPEVEQLLIADGGSDPSTLDCLERWATRDSRVIWSSQPDQGPADALNRAYSQAQAGLVGWLNADDRYEEGALARAVHAFEQNPHWQMVYGHGQHIDANGALVELYPSCPPDVGIEGFQDGCFVCQPTVVLRDSFLQLLGGFDIRSQACFDLALWLRAFAAAPEAIGFIQAVQASTRLHANTITARQQWKVNLESAALLYKACGHVADHWFQQAACYWPGQVSVNQLSLEPILLERLNHALNLCRNLDHVGVADPLLPSALQLLLHSRLDLQACGFHEPRRKREFAQWIILHGLREYPALCEGDSSTNPLLAWLAEDSELEGVSRIALAIWDSTARHQRVWPLPRRIRAYRHWLKRHWKRLPHPSLPSYAALFGMSRRRRLFRQFLGHQALASKPMDTFLCLPGVNLVGYASHALGVGEDVRTTALALRQLGVCTAVVDFPPMDCQGRELLPVGLLEDQPASYKATLLCLTPEETMRYVLSHGKALLTGKYVIGYWPWELPHWPQQWRLAFDLVDEIWVSSRHIQASLVHETTKPVRLMPLCVDAQDLCLVPPSDSQLVRWRSRFGLPLYGMLALCSFDLNSSMARKNPWAAIYAFQRSFPLAPLDELGYDVALVVKTFPPMRRHREWERLKQLAALDKRIHIIEQKLDRDELSGLYGCCDVLLSLHRAEGFGRVLAEALQLGLDVIATDWGGNQDFCHGPLAHAVPYSLVPVPAGAYPHWQNQVWAQPDLPVAADMLFSVLQRRYRQGRPAPAVSSIYRQVFSASTCGKRYRDRLEQLGLINESVVSHDEVPNSNLQPQD